MSQDINIDLGHSLDIAHAAALKQLCAEHIDSTETLQLNAAALERFDAAGLQLLAALTIHRRKQDLPLNWQSVPESLMEAASGLGLAGLLQLDNELKKDH